MNDMAQTHSRKGVECLALLIGISTRLSGSKWSAALGKSATSGLFAQSKVVINQTCVRLSA